MKQYLSRIPKWAQSSIMIHHVLSICFNQKMAIYIYFLRNENGIAFFIGNRFEMLVGGSRMESALS